MENGGARLWRGRGAHQHYSGQGMISEHLLYYHQRQRIEE